MPPFETLREANRYTNSESLSCTRGVLTAAHPNTSLEESPQHSSLAVLTPARKGGKDAARSDLRSEYLNLKCFHSYFKERPYLLTEFFL
jgi:hypothetical protein